MKIMIRKTKTVMLLCISIIIICLAGYNLAESFAASNRNAADSITADNDNITGSETDIRELRAVHVYDAKVYIDGSYSIGQSKYGGRNIVPIAGGTFEGPDIRGEVVPGGADWQTVRPDGDTELYARYTLKTDDGYYIQVTNKVLQHFDGSERYVRSVLDFEAPLGSPYEWLNHAIFLGTLTVPGPQDRRPDENMFVIIGVYKLL